MWSYSIASSTWQRQSAPETVDRDPVERSAEGSGVNIPALGRGMYFGGHLDAFTTADWDISVARVYLKSLLEFTFPGRVNTAIEKAKPVGSDGAWRNITRGGIQQSAGFTERADGVLIYVPGYGDDGILLGLAGGTNQSFTQMNVIDVYDIAKETWYKQATSGPTPEPRVNPCAVATTAADGSSIQIHMFAGQKLLPYGEQEQFDDMWILSVPSFTWIEIDTDDQSVPPGRSGHTCHVWNAQMVVVGGYVGEDLSCDSPGIYVFNTSSLAWSTEYAALNGGNDLNQQEAQSDDPKALSGSYGYAVPDAVQKVIGGDAMGSATMTAPAQLDSEGPIATGAPITYTVTESDVRTATETSAAGKQVDGENDHDSGPNIAAIVAGTLAGILGTLAVYLGFCTWIYRKRLALYKRHVAMAQRHGYARAGEGPEEVFGVPASGKGHHSSLSKDSFDDASGAHSGSKHSRSHNHSDSHDRHTVTSIGNGIIGNGYQQIPHTHPLMGNPIENSVTTSSASKEALPSFARSNGSGEEDLLQDREPTFLGVMMSPRRSLRVINHD